MWRSMDEARPAAGDAVTMRARLRFGALGLGVTVLALGGLGLPACSDDATNPSIGRDAEAELPPEGSPDPDALGDVGPSDAATDAGLDPGGSGGDGWVLPDVLEPGEIGAPCDSNSDCFSGFCVPSNEGHVCSKLCVDDCPVGWSCKGVSNGIDVTFICLPPSDRLCEPCTVDYQCGGGLCLTFPDGPACTSPCETGDDCPAGWLCEERASEDDLGGATSGQCVPVTGTCGCTPWVDGLQRSCSRANDFGTCWGAQTCDGLTGWGECSGGDPEAEVCDGQDNDCDGLADEDLTPPEPQCAVTNEHGACQGTPVCQGAAGWVCAAKTPAAEVCNYLDDDCDGVVDQPFRGDDGQYSLDAHCGACNVACTDMFPNATGTCDASSGSPVCVVASCAPGYYAVNATTCLPLQSSECLPCKTDAHCATPGDRCLSFDGGQFCGRDCSDGNAYGTPAGTCPTGYVCAAQAGGGEQCVPETGSCACKDPEDHGVARACIQDNAHGQCAGLEVCDAATGWSACSAAVPGPEVCNGVDDDCDGQTDEGVAPPSDGCVVESDYGACGGDWKCGGGAGWVCDAPVPAAESCNYLDDDCDGQTDEGFRDPASDLYDSYEHCGQCGASCEGAILFAVDTQCVQDAAAGEAYCVAVSCEPGYFSPPGNERLCIPAAGGGDCSPCSEDSHCAGLPGGTCESLDGGNFCVRGCSPAEGCPDGFACGDDWLCRPVSLSCSCLPGLEGAMRPCMKGNSYGACSGTQMCDPGATPGWSACTAKTPEAEVCNGLDDDCNGLVDDGVLAPTEPCAKSNEHGSCGGAWACQASGPGAADWVCQAKTPAAETCNYADDDCDGEVDEPFKQGAAYVDDAHCGACGVGCAGAIEHATAHCVASGGAPRCEVAGCDPGYYQAGPLTCLAASDDVCAPCQTDAHCPTPGDACVPLDGGSFCGRDCAAGNLHGAPEGQCPAGFTCQSFGSEVKQCVPTSGSCGCLAGDAGKTRPCLDSNAWGSCYGVETCDPASGWSGCSAQTPAEEVCNGVDDDCDGVADDVDGKGEGCTIVNAHGECSGVLQCSTGDPALTCVGPTPAPEACNYVDDDCDGQVDEGFGDLYAVCTVGQGACTRVGVRVCNVAGDATVCNAEPGLPSAEVCDGVDNDCDGQTDEGALWAGRGTVCTAGLGVCAQAGVKVCDPGDPSGPLLCNAEPGAAQAEACDYLDNDCDGQTDEDWKTADLYAADQACGNCNTDCTAIYEKPNARGVCNVAGGGPACAMTCCKAGDGYAACDGVTDYFDLNAVPDDGCELALDPEAIYVSASDPQASDAVGCGRGPVGTGLGRYPCQSIGAGLAEAVTTGRKRVLVADGLYEETVTVAPGVSLLGGYRADTWERHLSSTLTTLRGVGTSKHLKTLLAQGVDTATVVEGFLIYGPANFAAGGNSYAVWIVDSTSALTLRHNVIFGGYAGDGAGGGSGGDGADGGDGQTGQNSIETDVYSQTQCNNLSSTPGNKGTAGDGGQATCGGAAVHGGDGAGATCPDDNDQQPNGASGTQASGGGAAGAGGAGGYDRRSTNCGTFSTGGKSATGLPGTDGSDGNDGTAGSGCAAGVAQGAVTGNEWVGVAGAAGADGKPGGGGGGGGAGGGADVDENCSGGADDTLGGSGGGGGSGACPGLGGSGGGSGGGAFAVFISRSSPGSALPTLTSNTLLRGVGGRGGDGGLGGAGGLGGDGGNGGLATGRWAYAMGNGGRGGQGGDGGHGGGGGGGCGGASYALFVHNVTTTPTYATTNTFGGGGEAGPGGSGGPSLGHSGTSGAPGVTANTNY